MENKEPKERIITGCSDCPMCDMNDMASGYSCRLRDSSETSYIKEDLKKWQPVTPDWCPIKEQPILLTFNTEKL
ncbi:MAG: hypothetical protein AABY15_02765 [Nanoarchaeota archaeon]